MKISSLLCSALFASVAVSANADVILAPGATYEYTFSDPTASATWNTTLGGWTTGAAPFGNTGGGDFGANTVWPASGDRLDDLWVRIGVDLTGYNLSTIAFDLGVDNGFKLYANGTFVAGDNAEGFTSRWEYTGSVPAGSLHSGVNVFAVALEDHGGLTAFDMQLRGDRRPSGVPDGGSTLGVLGLALAGLGLYRRKA